MKKCMARGSLLGHIGSDGWAYCNACGYVEEPVFPSSYQDMDGRVTVYYCRHCYKLVVGRTVESNNTYDNDIDLEGERLRKERKRMRKVVEEIYGKKKCPSCDGTGKVPLG